MTQTNHNKSRSSTSNGMEWARSQYTTREKREHQIQSQFSIERELWICSVSFRLL